MVDRSRLKIPEFHPLDLTRLPVKLPKIEIDDTKCTVPFWCKKCLQACPHLVFWVESRRDERLKETDPREPRSYRLFAVRRDKCTLCKKCVDVCPEGAITITYEGQVFKGTKKADTAEEARRSPYDRYIAPQPYSFDLDEHMMSLLRQEFGPQGIIEKFSRTIGEKREDLISVARDVFGKYGKAWMRRVIQLGEEYPDRTFEFLKDVVDATGEYYFPHVPQRFVEIAYLSTQEFLQLPILENYRKCLVYQVPNCHLHRLLTEKCGVEIAEVMPCKYACLSALDTMCNILDIEAVINMEAETTKDGYCQFSLNRI